MPEDNYRTHANDKHESRLKSFIDLLRNISVIVGSISAGFGVAVSAWTYTTTQWKKDAEERRAQLSTYSTYGQYLKNYQETIQPALGRMMADETYKRLDSSNSQEAEAECRKLLKQETRTKTGFELWGSKAFEDFRVIHNFYESIGFGLTNSQLDFQIIFDLITYPEYWNIQNPDSEWYHPNKDTVIDSILTKTKTFLDPDFKVIAPVANCLGSHYFGINKPLSDFSDGVRKLGYNYLFARMKYVYNARCEKGKARIDEQAAARKIDSRDSTRQDSNINKSNNNACMTLQNRINLMSRSEHRIFPWAKLYANNKNDIDPLLIINFPGAGTPRLLLKDWSLK